MKRHWGFWLSAILGILAFPPISLWPLAFIALVPFLWSATDPEAHRVYRPAWRAGYLFFAGVLYWVGLNSGAPWWMSVIAAALMFAILATIWGLTAWAVKRASGVLSLAESALLFVVLYKAFEVFWGTGEMGFPWAEWGLALSSSIPAIQLAEWIDTPGLSLWVLTINALLFLTWQQRRKTLGVLAAVLIVAPLVWGSFRAAQVDRSSAHFRAAAVQANTPAETKWQMSAADILADHVRLTDGLAPDSVDFISWPETAVPSAIRYRHWAAESLYAVANRTDAVVLTGATDYILSPDEEEIPLNAAFVIRPHARALESSSKVRLVPFGERIPGQKWLPFLKNLHLGQAEFKPADSVTVFPAGTVPPFACLICFEVVFP
ncbi:MAG: apolipoprotein N-acyltransferase [bacterium]|nr:apolipoprotein N-acyltransferase [bacterium]